MNKRIRILVGRRAFEAAFAASAIILAFGCGRPSSANIALRKQSQERDSQIALLQSRHAADQADLASRTGPTTTSLGPDLLAKLYTTHGITIGRLTGVTHADASETGDDGLQVQVTPTDEDGQQLKAAGIFDITAFDLQANGQQLGKWHFDVDQARSHWLGSALMYAYVLPCPWQSQLPEHADVTLRVSFIDALTGRKFVEQTQVRVAVRPATSNAPTQPATTR